MALSGACRRPHWPPSRAWGFRVSEPWLCYHQNLLLPLAGMSSNGCGACPCAAAFTSRPSPEDRPPSNLERISLSLIGPANIRPGIPKTISRTLICGDNRLDYLRFGFLTDSRPSDFITKLNGIMHYYTGAGSIPASPNNKPSTSTSARKRKLKASMLGSHSEPNHVEHDTGRKNADVTLETSLRCRPRKRR